MTTKDPELLKLQPGVRCLLASYKAAAYGRGHSWDLTPAQAGALFHGDCDYCGDPPIERIINPRNANPYVIVVNGIDRVDNDLGYTPENSVSCCKVCNQMKRDLGADTFRNHCAKVSKIAIRN